MANPNTELIDLTTEPKDFLTALPLEIQHFVFDYLLPTHEPDIAFETEGASRKLMGVPHPLDHLAASCKQLRQSVDVWARHWLKRHANITGFKDLKNTKSHARRRYLRGKGRLLTWAEKHCIFCGKSSTRSAILVNGLRCCQKCDKEQWPNKITKTDAKKMFDLQDHHLLPERHGQASSLPKPSANFPRLRYGTYFSSNVPTTMFLTADVRRLAEVVHGDIDQHMNRRKANAEARKQRKAERAAQKHRMDMEWLSKSKSFHHAEQTGQSIEVAGRVMQSLGDQLEVAVDMPHPVILKNLRGIVSCT
jgi:hypothetical protein